MCSLVRATVLLGALVDLLLGALVDLLEKRIEHGVGRVLGLLNGSDQLLV